MAEPIISQTFVGFAGEHEDISVGLLPEIFSSDESQNVEINRRGEIQKILGYLALNSAITTNTGGDAVRIAGLAFYRGITGGTVTRKIVAVVDDGVDEYEIWHSSDGGVTFSFLIDLGSGPVGNNPRFQQDGNDLYICVGSGVPQVYNGTTVATAGGTQSPTPTLTAGAAGNCKGTYQCVVVSMVGKDRGVASALSTAVELDDEIGAVSFTAVGGSVTGYEIYFTTGTGKQFRLSGYVTNPGSGTVNYSHNLSDENLRLERVLDEFGDPPPSGSRYLGMHQQRMFWDRGNAAPDEWVYSTPGDSDGITVNNFLRLRDPEGPRDQNTGFTGNFNDFGIFWQEFCVWRVSGSGEIINNVPDLRLEKTAAAVGAVSDLAVARVPAGAKYIDEEGEVQTIGEATLVYFSSYLDIRAFDSYNDKVISYPKATFLAGVAPSERKMIWCEHDKLNKQVSWHFSHGATWGPPGPDSVQPTNKGVRWDYGNGTWTELSNSPFSCGCAAERLSGSNNVRDPYELLVGSPAAAIGGYVYRNKFGNNYDGVGNNISAKFWTTPLSLFDAEGNPAGNRVKRLRRIHVVMKGTSGSQDLTIKVYDDYADSGATPHGTYTLDMQATNAGYVHGRAVLRDSTTHDFIEARAPRIELMDNADDEAWAIEKIVLEYQTLPGIRRS